MFTRSCFLMGDGVTSWLCSLLHFALLAVLLSRLAFGLPKGPPQVAPKSPIVFVRQTQSKKSILSPSIYSKSCPQGPIWKFKSPRTNWGWQRAHFIRVPAGKNPIGCGFVCEFVPVGTSLILTSTVFFLVGMKMLYRASKPAYTRVFV
jgi:hypothetical protein